MPERGKDVLGLASGGGQQIPLLAAAGAKVTSFDISDEQLALDHDEAVQNKNLTIKYPLPYSDLTSLSAPEREKLMQSNSTLQFSHSLDDQIGGQLKAGLLITGFYEDGWEDEATPLNRFGPMYIATLARKRLPSGD